MSPQKQTRGTLHRLNKVFTHAKQNFFNLATSHFVSLHKMFAFHRFNSYGGSGRVTQQRKKKMFIYPKFKTQRNIKLIEYDITCWPLYTVPDLSRSFTLRTNSSMSHLILLGIASCVSHCFREEWKNFDSCFSDDSFFSHGPHLPSPPLRYHEHFFTHEQIWWLL